MALVTAIVLATFTRTFIVQAFKIPSHSMEPGLRAGDHILVNKFIYGDTRLGNGSLSPLLPTRPIRRGDIVVFSAPGKAWQKLVKRCLGLPGDLLTLGTIGLAIDGRQLDESAYIFVCKDVNACSSSDLDISVTVPEDHAFCLGDRRDQSNDSRSWGTVPSRLLIGRPVAIYWSIPSRLAERAYSWDKIGFTWWILNSRWERSLMIVR